MEDNDIKLIVELTWEHPLEIIKEKKVFRFLKLSRYITNKNEVSGKRMLFSNYKVGKTSCWKHGSGVFHMRRQTSL